MTRTSFITCLILLAVSPRAGADDLIYRWEADVLPYDPSAGWIVADPCNDWPGGCTESLEDGRFRLSWPENGSGFANYHYWVTEVGDPPHKSLWVEWRFRSNKPLDLRLVACDAKFAVGFGTFLDIAYMDGDAVVSFDGSGFILGLALGEFHTYRFESPDRQY